MVLVCLQTRNAVDKVIPALGKNARCEPIVATSPAGKFPPTLESWILCCRWPSIAPGLCLPVRG